MTFDKFAFGKARAAPRHWVDLVRCVMRLLIAPTKGIKYSFWGAPMLLCCYGEGCLPKERPSNPHPTHRHIIIYRGSWWRCPQTVTRLRDNSARHSIFVLKMRPYLVMISRRVSRYRATVIDETWTWLLNGEFKWREVSLVQITVKYPVVRGSRNPNVHIHTQWSRSRPPGTDAFPISCGPRFIWRHLFSLCWSHTVNHNWP